MCALLISFLTHIKVIKLIKFTKLDKYLNCYEETFCRFQKHKGIIANFVQKLDFFFVEMTTGVCFTCFLLRNKHRSESSIDKKLYESSMDESLINETSLRRNC